MTYADIKLIDSVDENLSKTLANAIVCTDLKLLLTNYCIPTEDPVMFKFSGQDMGEKEKLLAKIEIPGFKVREKVQIVRNELTAAIVDQFLMPAEIMLNLSEAIKKTGVLKEPDKATFTLNFAYGEDFQKTAVVQSGCKSCYIPWCWC